MELIDITGYVGATGLLLAYWQLNRGKWNSRSVIYQSVNFVAGVLLIGYSLSKHAYANVVLNLVFCGIAMYGLQKIRHDRIGRIPK